MVIMFARLKEMGEYYEKKKPEGSMGKIELNIDDDSYLIELKKDEVEVHESVEGCEKDIQLKMSEETFDKLASGVWNGMTATGRSHISESAPLDFHVPEGELEGETLQLLYHFLTHFFSSSYPTVTELGREHSRKIHGGHAVPIAYGHGVRYAYYTIKKGEQINEDESDPWDQVFTVISGTGTAMVDGKEIELRKNMSVHVPPRVQHVVKKENGEDELELLWMAYGEKA